MKIKTKLLLLTIVLTLFVAGAILVENIVLFSDFVDTTTADRLEAASKVAVHNLDFIKARVTAASLSMSENPSLVKAIENSNRGELLLQALQLRDEAGVDFCTVTDAEGTVIMRTHDPASYGDSIASQTNIRSALTGERLALVERGNVVGLSVRSGSPILNEDGEAVGVVSVGVRLDTEQFVDSIKDMLDCEATVFLGDERVATTILLENGTRALGTKADARASEIVLAGNYYDGDVDILGRASVGSFVPIIGPDGQTLGMLFVGYYKTEMERTIWAFIRSGLIVGSCILTAFIAALLTIITRIVTPIQDMTKAAIALAAGDTGIDIQVDTKDEMSTLADAFNSMIENTRRQIQTVKNIAEGDLIIEPLARSERDFMNIAIEKLNETLKAQAAAIRDEHKRMRIMLDATPLACRLWTRDFQLLDCNEAAVKLFNLQNKREYIDRYFELSPEYQPNGLSTREQIRQSIGEAFEKGMCVRNWMYRTMDGTPIPAENTMVRVPYGNDYVVAAYSRDLREQNKMLAEIEHRDALLQTVNQAAEVLLRSEPEDFPDTLNQCMGMMARAIEADCMYLYKNYTINGKLYCAKLYEWSENAPQIQDGAGDSLSYDEQSPSTKAMLSQGKCVHSLVRDLPPSDRAQLEGMGVRAIMTIPVFIHDVFWGFVGFDNCHSEETFTENEEYIMRSGSLLVANALLRNEYMQDIRESSAQLQNALEEAKDANNAKSTFLARMSHEIRTPLNAVIGLGELMLAEGNMSRGTEINLEKICTAGSTILSIVNDILDISKIESGKLELYPVLYDTPSLINDIVTLNIVRIGEKPITFKLSVNENLPGSLFGDDLRVKQIFSNLLSNAFKYTNSGTVEWRISFERDGGSVWLISSVQDTGIGLKPGDIKHLFSDYQQADASANRKVEGTGLGLPIAKRLVEMMDGSITVESEYGKGSTFHVRMRQSFVSDTPIGKEVAWNLMSLRYTLSKRDRNRQLPHVNLSYANVLVVDDITTNLDVVKGMMKPYGMNIDCATSGKQAIEIIKAEHTRYSAVFMDHMMPGMDGMEATKIIREEIGTDYARNIPIIALTANAIVGNEEMFLCNGFQDFISKPIDMMKLDAVLRRWVRDKKLEEGLAAVEQDAPQQRTESESGGASLLDNLRIRGVDINKALERFSGDETVFIDVMRSYADNTRPLLSGLKEYIKAGNLSDYAIVVHGIKGSSYGIAAQEIGKAAEALEMAAKAGDFETVLTRHAVFEKNAESLLDDMDEALVKIGAVVQKQVADEPNEALLKELRAACAAFDMDRVDTAMERLELFRYKRGEKLVAWLREQVDNMAFEEIFSGEWPAK